MLSDRERERERVALKSKLHFLCLLQFETSELTTGAAEEAKLKNEHTHSHTHTLKHTHTFTHTLSHSLLSNGIEAKLKNN